MYDDILIPTDGSDGVQRAIDHGIDLASRMDATVHGLFVVDTTNAAVLPEPQWLTLEEGLEKAGERAVADVERRARQQGVDATATVRRGTPHEAIVDYATERDVDLVVMGTYGRTGIDRVLLGSVTDKVIRRVDAPVLVRRIDDADGNEEG